MLIIVDMPTEALKARKQAAHPGQMGFDFSAPTPEAPAGPRQMTSHEAAGFAGDASHGGHLHQEVHVDRSGHQVHKWVAPADAPTAPAPASAPEPPTPRPPAPVVHEEVGEHVGGSRKDEAEPTGPAKTRKAILEADPTAVQRDDLLHAVAAKDAQAAGYSPGGHHLREYIRKTVSPEPFAGRSDNWQRKAGTWTDPAVRAEKFNQACAFLNRTFDKCKTAADFRTALREFSDLGRSSVENRAMFMALGERFSSLAMGIRTDGSRKALSEADALDAKGWPEASDATRSAGARKRFSFADIRGEEFDRVGGRPVAGANAPQMAEDFGLRNIQFGEWLSQDDRAHHLKAAHTAFFDLADVLGVDPKHVAMRNLSLAFGGRGSGFTGSGSAHYETDKKIINLTKFAGGGSLAHEWGHFLDNMLGGGEYGYGSLQSMEGLSPQAVAAFDQLGTAMYGDSWKHMKTNAAAVDKHNALAKAGDRGGAAVQKNIAAASASLIQSADSTQFALDAAELGGTVGRRDEMFARAFEAFVQDELHDAGRKNTYLVSGTRGVHLTPKLARRSRASIAAEHARHDETLKANPEYTAAKAKADTAQDAWSQALAEKHSAVGKAAKAAEAKANEAYSAWSTAMVASARLRRTLVPEVDPHHDGTEHPIYAQPYPQGAERQAINRAMRGFLAALRTSGEVYKALEALKARKNHVLPGQVAFDFSAPVVPPEARGLHLEQRHVGGVHGHEQGFWVKPAEALKPADVPPQPQPAQHTWPLDAPSRDDLAAMGAWLGAAPEGAKIKAGEVSLVKHSARNDLWRVSGRKINVTSATLAAQLGPPQKVGDDGEDRDWIRGGREPYPDDLAGPISAEHPGPGHIEIADPIVSVEIPSAYMGRLKANLEKLQARAEKLGLPPLTYTIGDTSIRQITIGNPPDVLTRTVPVVTVMVRMPEIKIPGGWSMVGTVDHGQHGNKIYLQSRPKGLNAIALRTRANTCDHCHTVRDRKKTVILENDDGDIKHVGLNCVKDYLGHDVPVSGWDDLNRQMMAELYGFADDAWGDGEIRRGAGAPTERFMETAAAIIRLEGFKPRNNDRGDRGTADIVWQTVVAKYVEGQKQLVTPADKEHAAKVLAWVRDIPPNIESDFMHNLRMSLAGESVTPKDIGMAAAAFGAWQRAHNAAAPWAGKADGGFTGAVGDKIGTGKAHQHRPISGTVTQYLPMEGGAYGPSYLVKILGDDGKMYSSFMSNPRYTNAEHVEDLDRFGLVPHPAPNARNTSGSAQPGDRVLITGGTVKKHDEYRGEKSTALERMKYERTDIPDVSAARTGSKTGRFHKDHDLEFIEWARRHADAAGHKMGTQEHRDAMHAHLAAATRKWASDVGGHHYEGANGRAMGDIEAGANARPITEIARLNQEADAAARAAEAHKAIVVYFPPEALKALAVANRPGLHLDPVRHRWVNDLPPEQKAKVVGEAVRRSLSPDLLKQPYRQQVEQGAHPCTGHCYVASEAMYHLMGGKEAGYKPMNIQHEGGPHWWLDGPGGRHDLTAEQFSSPVPYHQGVGKGFMSKNGPDGRQLPSKRAETVMGKALQHLDAGPGAFRQAA